MGAQALLLYYSSSIYLLLSRSSFCLGAFFFASCLRLSRSLTTGPSPEVCSLLWFTLVKLSTFLRSAEKTDAGRAVEDRVESEALLGISEGS